MPYALKKRSDAIDYLDNHPLTITQEEADQTNKLIHASQIDSTLKRYKSFSPVINFDLLPTGVQTSVMSICFQYGPYSKALVNMWDALLLCDWAKLADFFENMSKKEYISRRKNEKEYLIEHLYD